jgi:hypothetical protein
VAGTVAVGRLAGAAPAAVRWSWTGLMGQAGLSLALAATVVKALPEIGDILRSLVLATVAVNQIVGPILFRLALGRCGEVGAADQPAAPALAPAPAPP